MDSGLRMDNKDKDRHSWGERATVQGVGRAGWEQRRGQRSPVALLGCLQGSG